jgi:hypothetical protein
VGDTPDDARAARSAGALPLGVLAPGEHDPLPVHAAGAGRVLTDPNAVETLLP